MKRFLVFFLLLFVSLPIGVSLEYYADVDLKIDEIGVVYIQGTSNYPSLNLEKTDYLTSKKGPYWLFNFTTKENFSDFFVSIEFPKDIEINYIKVNGNFRITESPNLKIIAIGKNEPVEIAVQYVMLKKTRIDYNFLVIAVVLAVFSLGLFFKGKKTAKQENKAQENVKEDKLKIIKHTLTDNQKLILDILMQAKEPITQKQLNHRTKLPKATLSRNLELLKQKNIIQKQSRGMVNVIFLNEDFKK